MTIPLPISAETLCVPKGTGHQRCGKDSQSLIRGALQESQTSQVYLQPATWESFDEFQIARVAQYRHA
jgi:hypothetical protein